MSREERISVSESPSMPLLVRYLGLCPYTTVWDSMQNFTNERDESSRDELWMVQHFPVFTQGQAGKAEHIFNAGGIPVVKSDRGGQVTYHGPGQLIAYPMLNIRRLGIGVRDLVTCLENSVIHFLKEFDVEACAKKNAPGVYVKGKKIASLGLRVRKGCSFHGVSLNVDMDLAPFLGINPCGYNDMQMTQLSEFVDIDRLDLQSLQPQFAQSIAKAIGYDAIVTE